MPRSDTPLEITSRGLGVTRIAGAV